MPAENGSWEHFYAQTALEVDVKCPRSLYQSECKFSVDLRFQRG